MQETFTKEAKELLQGRTIVLVDKKSIVFSNGLEIHLDENTIRELNEVAS